MGSSVLAVFVGFVLIGLLSFAGNAAIQAAAPDLYTMATGTTNVPILLLITVMVGVFATFGCWLTGRMAPANPMKHALILGVLGLAFNVFSALSAWSLYPAWFSILNLLLVMPYAWLGGRLAEAKPPRGRAIAA